MFILRDIDKPLKWPVNILSPLSGGAVEKRYGFTAHFTVYDTDKLKELQKLPDPEFIAAIMPGWECDLVDGEKKPIPFSEETRDKLSKTTWIRNAIINAYWDMMSGREGKN